VEGGAGDASGEMQKESSTAHWENFFTSAKLSCARSLLLRASAFALDAFELSVATRGCSGKIWPEFGNNVVPSRAV
jgi:hypothetical protein